MRSKAKFVALALAVIAVTPLLDGDVRAGWWKRSAKHPIDALTELPGMLGSLPAPPEDPENPVTPAKVELGLRLFKDTRLSGDESLSCASCHPPETGYAEAVKFSAGAEGQPMPRHSPTVLNSAYYKSVAWDGRFATITQLVLAVLANPKNMNLQDETVLVARLEAVPEYRAMFRDVFGGGPTKLRVAQAIDAYIRDLNTPNSAFDRYVAGDKNALTLSQKRGLMLFVGKSAARYYGAGSAVYVRNQATEERFKAEAPRYRVLHVASHGILNDTSPMHSYLLLAAGDAKAEDGYLEAGELMHMDLGAELVVLSACETARGKYAAGEGIIGFSWALFAARCRTQVVSQWKVDSAATRVLMRDFHRNVRNDRTRAATALQKSIVSMLRTKEYRHPFYWAGFVVLGDTL